MSFLAQRPRQARRVFAAALLAGSLGAPAAASASVEAVWAECREGQGISTHHTQAEFREAITALAADGAEYSECADLIRAAQIQAALDRTSRRDSRIGAGPSGAQSRGDDARPPAVEAAALRAAIASSGADPSALAPAAGTGSVPAGPASVAPPQAPTVVVAGKPLDLRHAQQPSIAGALALPLPLALSGLVVLLAALLPLLRYLVVRFGGPSGGSAGPPA